MLSFLFLSVTFLFANEESAYLERVEALRHEQGLFLDRGSDRTTVSSAATGFGVLAMAQAAARGLRDEEAVRSMARNAFDKTIAANPEKNRGWLSHFTDTNGYPKDGSEVSTIDTAIFYRGMLKAAELLKDQELEARVRSELAKIDLAIVLRDGVFLHGFRWSESADQATQEQPTLISYAWNDSSEGAILYQLFGMEFPMHVKRLDYPLFVYAYPLCFDDLPAYEQLLQDAIQNQIERFGYWGVTSTDGPDGYVSLDANVISPILIHAIGTKFPNYLEPMKHLSLDASAMAVHLPTGWKAQDDLTIDLASAYVLYARWSNTSSTAEHLAMRVDPQTVDAQ